MEKLKIKTKRLTIRNLHPKDIENFHVYRSNPEVTRYQGFDVMDLTEAKEFVEGQKDKLFGVPGEWVQYGIENLNSGQLIGDCAIKLHKENPTTASVGITISHLSQQNGFGKEVFEGILAFLFDQKGVEKVVERVDADNEASIKLLHSTGFQQEGDIIKDVFFKGNWGAEYEFAMRKADWELREA